MDIAADDRTHPMKNRPTEIESLLRSLTGIVKAERLNPVYQSKIGDLEEKAENAAVIPILNLGIRLAVEREIVYVLLKNECFRQPPAPTVYLVEKAMDTDEIADSLFPADSLLVVDQIKFRIIGEEVMDPANEYKETTSFLGKSFVMFPQRRSSNKTPAYFLIPPLPFTELEEKKENFGISDIISISPSINVDTYLRELLCFSKDKRFATLLIGFNSTY